MSENRLYLLGDFQFVDSNGRRAEISLSKEIGLIALLALSKDLGCARSKIIDLLWSDRCGEQGRASLRHALWSLRKTLNRCAPGVLQIDRRRVCLSSDDCSIDARDFVSLASSQRHQDLERAVLLYRGELLETLVVNDREWEAWLGIERSRLQMVYAECLYRLSKHYLLRRDAGKLMGTGLRLIAHNPLWEQGHRALMEAYALTHQKSLALKQYERYREMIHRELDSHPERDMQQLYERIKSGACGGGLQLAPAKSG